MNFVEEEPLCLDILEDIHSIACPYGQPACTVCPWPDQAEHFYSILYGSPTKNIWDRFEAAIQLTTGLILTRNVNDKSITWTFDREGESVIFETRDSAEEFEDRLLTDVHELFYILAVCEHVKHELKQFIDKTPPNDEETKEIND